MVKKSISSFTEEVMRMMPSIIRGTFRRKDVLLRGKITIPQYLSLDLLDSQGLLKMKDIARQLKSSLPATTGLINRLFKMGAVQRVYDEKDRRVIYIRLTPKGKRIVSQVKSKRKKLIEDVFSRLTEKERITYLSILRKIMKILHPNKR